jgi:hypothetical protein
MPAHVFEPLGVPVRCLVVEPEDVWSDDIRDVRRGRVKVSTSVADAYYRCLVVTFAHSPRYTTGPLALCAVHPQHYVEGHEAQFGAVGASAEEPLISAEGVG